MKVLVGENHCANPLYYSGHVMTRNDDSAYLPIPDHWPALSCHPDTFNIVGGWDHLHMFETGSGWVNTPPVVSVFCE